ncbi:MAG TPA: prenyltransferase/squalene oxidase repeat-containing protein [Gemmataceae bacterium]|nr:prenyltransferase/squalene oxidase repeat-containing protein [Gemmataceae bacterium]
MALTTFPARLETAYQTALAALLAERTPEGHWVGELSSSALSTATAISALALVQKHTGDTIHQPLIDGGVAWLAANQNADGGWGDTVKSLSNISTTMLCRAALHLTGAVERERETTNRAERWLAERYGKTPAELAEAVRQRYGKDRTFSVPILTTCALAGLVSWDEVPPLPFELACFPQSWFRFLRLHVVSYALPALIAIGQCVYHHKKPWNPITRLLRWLARGKSLKVLRAIQPTSGGYLEATPLTSFVTMSLAACGLARGEVAQHAIHFLVRSVRPDGSWAIDTNLATWVTTLAVNAISVSGEFGLLEKQAELRDWLLQQQYKERHAYTGAAPGGWAWTDLPGGVPDGDDTPGAILALASISKDCDLNAVQAAVKWLINLQNNDGGSPTFCRGWGHLPFDRSGSDLTAHVLRALFWWRKETYRFENHSDTFLMVDDSPEILDQKVIRRSYECIHKGISYLARTQRPDGSWLPLWFGNQHAPDDTNPTYGTARVLAAYRDLSMMDTEPAQRGVHWLLDNQNDDGGWGGCKGCPSSIEETSLAVEVLLDAESGRAKPQAAVNKGLVWLVEQVESGGLQNPTPIGFYFAKLWYFEKLYPMIFAVGALGRARRKLAHQTELAPNT